MTMNRMSGLVLLLLFSGLMNGCAFVNVPLLAPPRPLDEQVLEGEGKKKILLLDVSGIVSEREKSGGMLSKGTPSMVDRVREALKKAEADDDIAGVIVRINSPGGTVTASDIIRHDINGFRSRRKVPVHACIMGVGASGGYYIATAADRIIAHPTAITGSIGVLLLKFNIEGLLDKIGVREQTIKSGEKKDILSPFRAATPEEQKLVQAIIDQLYGRFLDSIMARPNNTLGRKELETLADGRIYTAEQAFSARLIDKTGYLDDVIADMKKQLGVDQAKIVAYYRPGSYKGSIYAESSPDATSIPALFNLTGGADLIPESQFMYLWQP
ncbi:MAG TPA: signal peptide peptidase SppA [Geobacteraceae bacterium]|nr:signal peptide peptidase SppA [Geobacteraceae bacterium]